jgi:predicted aspartyl protease
LHDVSGVDSVQSVRIRASIQGQQLLMLVDSGSTTSFISETMVKKLGLQTETCYPAKVKVANGGIMESDKMVKEVRW